MKKVLLILLILTTVCSSAQNREKDEIIELDIKIVNGIIPFAPSYNYVYLQDRTTGTPWEETKMEVTGIPSNWENPVVQIIQFDPIQFIYQNYKQGNLEEQFVEGFLNHLHVDLKELDLSEKPIKCFSHIALTKLDNGDIKYRIDTNNNLDFSDEETFSPNEFPRTNLQDIDALSKKCHWIDGEVFSHNKVKSIKYAYNILKEKSGALLANFPQFAKAKYKDKTLIVSSGFTDPSFYKESTLIVVDSSRQIQDNQKIELEEFFEIEGQTYKNLGVDFSSQKLRIQKRANAKDAINSTQVGFPAISFGGTDFLSDTPIQLDDYKGKYLFFEFWGTWCGPCVIEMPELKSLYEKLDKNKIEFLGIANDSPESLEKYLLKAQIPWKQILSSTENNLVKKYGVLSFPTNYLINDKGEIVAKNLRVDQLSKQLQKFMN
ncbi:TlpA family protein disulfide reductase [Leeuwenhoekiella polynyae]|uniref:Peroxiredoxin n=1 Tax=Leeuwenhoekiella polynyae TaxID=1550906 RepID=A0A4Q0PGJ4_9FLAO|nr:TlpA disulfide reductase family protein [Leeuwenhoekiella polynyae]RXG26089.1 peroxiredoxin [Leeuwenhoekiella polynyae]